MNQKLQQNTSTLYLIKPIDWNDHHRTFAAVPGHRFLFSYLSSNATRKAYEIHFVWLSPIFAVNVFYFSI